tara:strand:+ start:448 stop:921 length:474 start_codon:yes stop_codon:yes gene_type:complete
MEEKVRLRVHRVRENAKLPLRAHPSDAGADLFYCPQKEHALYGEDFCIHPRESKIVPTGIKVEVPHGYMLEIKNKSSVAAKKQLIVGACVVDSGYNGEVFVNLQNVGERSRIIEPGQKIAQAVMIPVEHCVIEECDTDTLNQNSSRGDGALGSTGDR